MNGGENMNKKFKFFCVQFIILIATLQVKASEVQMNKNNLLEMEDIREEKNKYENLLDKICSIQINTMKIKKDDFGVTRLRDLLKDLYLTTNQGTIEDIIIGNEYHTLIVGYGDKNKDIYKFFQYGEKWYLQNDDGKTYPTADFITEYLSVYKSEIEYNAELNINWFSNILCLNKFFDKYDLNFYFINNVLENLNEGLSEEKAIENAEINIKEELTVYYYALSNGYDLNEEKYKIFIEEYENNLINASNYKRLEKLCEKNNTSLKEQINKLENILKVSFTLDNLYQEKYEEFRNGNDVIGDKECWSVSEYWQEFLVKIVFPDMESEKGNIENSLKEAKEFYEMIKDKL